MYLLVAYTTLNLNCLGMTLREEPRVTVISLFLCFCSRRKRALADASLSLRDVIRDEPRTNAIPQGPKGDCGTGGLEAPPEAFKAKGSTETIPALTPSRSYSREVLHDERIENCGPYCTSCNSFCLVIASLMVDLASLWLIFCRRAQRCVSLGVVKVGAALHACDVHMDVTQTNARLGGHVQKPDVCGLEGLDESPPAVTLRGPSGKVYSGTSMCCFRQADLPRRLAIRLVEIKSFELCILFTILSNCATMAWESPLDPCCTPKASFIDVRGSRSPRYCLMRSLLRQLALPQPSRL